MLTITPTTMATTLAQRIPGSPAQIQPSTSLADLRAIRASWAQSARDLGYPEMAFKVTTWLGREIVSRPSGRVFKVWSSGNVFALVREYSEQYIPLLSTSLIIRSLAVFTGSPDIRRTNLLDQIVLSDNLFKVAYWRWQFVGNEIMEMEDNYFLPGRWFNAFLCAEIEADGVIRQARSEQIENERLTLLAEMLAGQTV
ncbi:MAG: hypothetical protein WCK35_24855 [Chloroflexota bacterium]